MHRIAQVFVGVLTFASSSSFADEGKFLPPELVRAPVDQVFIPHGFDDNDDVELVLKGEFPNTCFKIGPATFQINQSKHLITIGAQAYRAQNVMCADVLVKFIQPIHLGMLEQGVYDVIIKDNRVVNPIKLEISPAQRPTQDDYLYPPVNSATIIRDESSQTDVLKIEGNYPYMIQGCMVTRELRTSQNHNGVLTVQPIAQLTDGEECRIQRHSTHYVIEKNIGKAMPSTTDYLIHVRTLNGSAVNSLIEGKAFESTNEP
jgi:hypothetical protein